VAAATPGYFRTMGIDLVRGRTFTEADEAASPTVGVVDERLAEAFWPGQDPIGQRVTGWGGHWTVVGVVRHVKNYGVAAESRQELYVPHAQRAYSRMYLMVHAAGDPAALIPAVRRLVAGLDPALPVYGARAMPEVVDETVTGPRLSAFLSGAYAVTALLLAVIGMYGLIAYVVEQRTRDIGVRIALGASAPRVLRLVVGQALRLAGAGVVVGGLASLAVTRAMRGMLFGVAAGDPVVFATTALILLATALAASAIPAWRAAHLSPLTALSDE
jgi:putative ABC transport system permease protein